MFARRVIATDFARDVQQNATWNATIGRVQSDWLAIKWSEGLDGNRQLIRDESQMALHQWVWWANICRLCTDTMHRSISCADRMSNQCKGRALAMSSLSHESSHCFTLIWPPIRYWRQFWSIASAILSYNPTIDYENCWQSENRYLISVGDRYSNDWTDLANSQTTAPLMVWWSDDTQRILQSLLHSNGLHSHNLVIELLFDFICADRMNCMNT